MRVMHKMTSGLRPSTTTYRERLSPSLWVLAAAAVSAPMVALVFVPLDATVALVAGVLVAAALIGGLVLSSPEIRVEAGELRVGRAHVPVGLLGEPEIADAERARLLRGPGLSRSAWHLFRPGIDGVVRVPLEDAGDPVTEWVFSTRTPDRVAAAIRRAQRS
ncbi:DUF3093 domain-containing protein [Microbacterium sp. PA5]|uniref:DUF3093 domain-containing protein n=1 Tax=Microbacterium sp. PA5 TaxID=3416654 RepID=UPI003CEAA63A